MSAQIVVIVLYLNTLNYAALVTWLRSLHHRRCHYETGRIILFYGLTHTLTLTHTHTHIHTRARTHTHTHTHIYIYIDTEPVYNVYFGLLCHFYTKVNSLSSVLKTVCFCNCSVKSKNTRTYSNMLFIVLIYFKYCGEAVFVHILLFQAFYPYSVRLT